MFASMIRLQREPAGPEVMRVPGGARVAIPLALIGFFTTSLTIGLALIPAPEEPNKVLAVTKVAGLTIVLVLCGALVYRAGRRRPDMSDSEALQRLDAARWRVALRLTAAVVRSTSASSSRSRSRGPSLAVQIVPGLEPRHRARRAGDRRLVAAHLGLRPLGQHALRPAPARHCGRGQAMHSDRRPRPRSASRTSSRWRSSSSSSRHARHHLVGGAPHPDHRAVLRRRPHASAPARTASRSPATT